MTTLSILHGASGIGAATLLGIGADMSDSYTKRAPMFFDPLFFDEWEGGGATASALPAAPSCVQLPSSAVRHPPTPGEV